MVRGVRRRVESRGAARADPRTACFYARRTLELAVSWAYKHDVALRLPYQDNLSAPGSDIIGFHGRCGRYLDAIGPIVRVDRRIAVR